MKGDDSLIDGTRNQTHKASSTSLWLCVHDDGRRVEDAGVNLCQELAQSMPVIGVISKARNDSGFRAEVQQLLPEAKNVVRVRGGSQGWTPFARSEPH